MKDLLLIGNWKMHKTIAESLDYMKAFMPLVPDCQSMSAFAVPFTAIRAMSSFSMNMMIGAQNINEEESGEFTCEISAAMIKEAGASFVLLGHSERRRLFHETDATINRKVQRALQHQLIAILCIGETKEEREKGETEAVLRRQIEQGLKGVDPFQIAQLVLAYEPVWAIGSTQSATPTLVEEAHQYCRRVLSTSL